MEDFLYKLQRSRILITVGGVLLFSLIAFNSAKIIMRNYDLLQQIDTLEEEIAVLQLRNENLRYQIAYFNTDAFLDLESRDKLNLAAPGENLLILPKNRYDGLVVDDGDTTDSQPTGIKGNLSNWVDFLFGNNQ